MSLYVRQNADAIFLRYEDGVKMDDICAEFLITPQTVRRVVRLRGGAIRRRGRQVRKGKQLDWVEEVKHGNSNPSA